MRLDKATYKRLVRSTGLCSHEACCGDNSSGIMSGVLLTLDVLRIQIDSNKFYEDVSNEANRLYDLEHPDEQ